MTDEQVIRFEARKLHEYELESQSQPTDDLIETIKSKLRDFYSPEYKAIFLDELKKCLNEELIAHREAAHGGKRGENCDFEKSKEVILFYINQEIDTLPKVVHQKFEDTSHQRNKVFVSYSHADKEALNDVKRHFKPFLKDIDFWDDTRIEPGQKWKEQIRLAIKQTKIAIILLSTDFLGSDFIATDELPPLLKAAEEDGATILIVIVKPCLFEEFPTLNQYQAMNAPSKTVLSMTYEEKEELWVNLVRQTKKFLNTENKQS